MAGVVLGLGAAAAPAQAQDDPRLLFGSEDILTLRQRVQSGVGLSIYNEIVNQLNPSADSIDDYRYEAMNNAYLYILTGEESYAARSRDMALEVIADAPIWAVDGSKGLTRAASNLAVAIAYDLCKGSTSWTADRTYVSQQLRANSDSLFRNGGAGWPGDGREGNNWWAVRSAASMLGYLASDEAGTGLAYGVSYNRLLTHFNSNLTNFSATPDDPIFNGWNPEGTGYTFYPWQFSGPAGVAAQRLRGQNLAVDGPASISKTIWAQFPGMLPIERPYAGGLIRGLHADYSDDNPSWDSQGAVNFAFAYAPQYAAGMKWQYARSLGELGSNQWSSDRGGAMYALLYYPTDLAEQNPADVYGKTYVDQSYGMALFRDRYQDDGDFVVQLSARGRTSDGGHAGPDVNGVRIIGAGVPWIVGPGRTGAAGGQSTVFKTDPDATATNGNFGVLSLFQGNERGDGLAITTSVNAAAATTTSSMGVDSHVRRLITDYTGRSGADALYVIGDTSTDGQYWRMNTPEFNTISISQTDPTQFTLLGPNGSVMYGKILVGDASTLRTGVFARDSATDPNSVGYPYGNQNYYNNYWLDFQASAGNAGKFLVVLSVYRDTNPAAFPTISYNPAGGINGTITVNDQVITIGGANSDVISVASWAPTTYGWAGTGGNWTSYGSWGPVGRPDTSTDAVSFTGPGGTLSLGADRTVNALTYAASAGVYTLDDSIGANTLRLRDSALAGVGNGVITQNSPVTQIINAAVYTPQTLSIAVNDVAGGLTFNGPVRATTLNKSGPGALTLAGAFDVSGSASLNSTGGTVAISGAIRSGAGSHALALTGSGITLGGLVDVADGGVLSLTGVSSGQIAKMGGGTLALPAANSYSGATTIGAGAVRAADGVGLPAASVLRLRGGVLESSGSFTRTLGTAAGQVNWTDGLDGGAGGFAAQGGALNVSLNGGAGLTWGQANFVQPGAALKFGSATADGQVTFANALNLGGDVRTVNVDDNAAVGSDEAVLAGVVSNGGLNKTGAGTLVLGATNTYSGATTVAGGSLRAVEGVGLPSASVLRLRGGVWEGSGSFTRTLGTGAGQVNWADGTDSGAGGFAAKGGDLSVNLSGGAALTWDSGGFVPDGAALRLGSATADSTMSLQNAIDLGSAVREVQVTDNAGSASDVGRLAGVLSGTGGLNKTGAGVLDLIAANSYTGPTQVNGGTLRLSASGALPTASAVSIHSSGTLAVNTAQAVVGSLTGYGQLALGANTALVGGANTSTRFNGSVTGTGSLVKTGTGTLTLGGVSSYTGTTTVEEGTLDLAGDATPGIASSTGAGSSPILLGKTTAGTNHAALVLSYGDSVGRAITVQAGNSGTATIGATNVLGTTSFTGAVVLNKGAVLTAPGGGTVAFTGPISGAGGITKTGTGTVQLANMGNTFAGATTISNGALQVNLRPEGSSLSSASVIELRGGVLQLNTSTPRALVSAADPAADRVTVPGHGLSNGHALLFTGATPGGVNPTNVYYATNVSGDSFQLSTTPGGSAIDLTTSTAGAALLPGRAMVSNADTTTEVITMTGHGLSAGQAIKLTTVLPDGTSQRLNGSFVYNSVSVPGGLNANNVYYVINPTADTFQVSNTPGGAAVDITGNNPRSSLVPTSEYLSGVDTTTETLTAPAHGLANGNALMLSGTLPGGLSSSTVYYVVGATANTFQVSTTVGGSAVNLTSTALGATITKAYSPVLGTGAGQLNWGAGGGGFAAWGQNRVVDINGGGPTTLTWGGTAHFVGDGQPLVFGSTTANAQVTVIDNLNLGSQARTVRVENNSFTTADLAVLSGVLSGTGGVVKAGPGTLVLSATNTYSGATTISEGALRATLGSNLPSASTLELRGGVLEISGGGGNNSTISSVNTGTETITTAASHSLASGQLIIFTGNVPAGLALNTPYYVRNPTANTLQLSLTPSGSLVDLTGTTTGAALSRPAYIAGLGTAAGNVNFGAGGGGFSAQGAARTVAIATGQVGGAVAWGAANFVPDGAPLIFGSETGGSTVTLINAIDLGAAAREVRVNFNTAQLSGVLSGPGGLTKTGTGTLQIAGTANTYTGLTTISAGTLQITGANRLPTGTEVTFTSSAATLSIQGFSQTIARLTGNGSVSSSAGAQLTVGDATNFTFSGSLNDNMALVKAGTGAMTLASTSGYSGTTTVANGTLVVTDYGALGSTAAGTTVNAGATLALDLGVSIAEPVTINGAGVGGAGAVQGLNGTTTVAANVTLASSSTVGASAGAKLTLAKALAVGAGQTLSKTGAGEVALIGTQTWGAGSALAVDQGLLSLATNPGTNAAVSVASGATLAVQNGLTVTAPTTLAGPGVSGSGALRSDMGVNTLNAAVTLAGDTTVGVTADTLTLAQAVGESGGPRALIKTGAGTLVLAAANTYSGPTTVSQGQLTVGSAGTLVNPAVTVASGATLAWNSSSTLDASQVTVQAGGTLSGSGSLSGDLAVSGRYAGAGTLSGNVSLAGSGVLAGTPTISGAVDGSGTIAPGNSPGITTVGQVNLTGGLDFAFEFTQANTDPDYGNAGASINDVLRITNPTTPFLGTAGVGNVADIYLNVNTLSDTDVFTGGWFTDLASEFSPTLAGASFNYYVKRNQAQPADVVYNSVEYYTLSNYNAYNASSYVFQVLTAGETADFGGGPINGRVTQFVVPEPGTLALLGLGAAAVLRRRRAAAGRQARDRASAA